MRDVQYSPAGWPQVLTGELYQPAGTGPFPGVLVVHGGGWNGRDRSDMEAISARLARHGYVVLNIDYRLAPQNRYPAAVEDVEAALQWLHDNAANLQLDANRIGGWGYSAGAHLVTLAALRRSRTPAHFSAIVAGGMPSDLTRYPNSPIIRDFIGGSYAELPQIWREASPIAHVNADSPPIFIYHGTWDRTVLFEDSVAMKLALDRAHVSAELYPVRAMGHIATFLFGFGSQTRGIAFLDQHLGVASRNSKN